MRIPKQPLVTFFTIILLASLAACATTTQTDTDDDWQRRDTQLQTIASIAFQARLVVEHKGNIWHFSMQWEQTPDGFTGKGYTALGNTVFEVAGNDSQSAITTSKGTTQQNSQQFIQQQLGLALTPSQLLELLMAIAQPGAQTSFANNQLRYQHLNTDNIKIDYQAYDTFNGHLLPKRLLILQENSKVKIAFSTWTLPNSPSI